MQLEKYWKWKIHIQILFSRFPFYHKQIHSQHTSLDPACLKLMICRPQNLTFATKNHPVSHSVSFTFDDEINICPKSQQSHREIIWYLWKAIKVNDPQSKWCQRVWQLGSLSHPYLAFTSLNIRHEDRFLKSISWILFLFLFIFLFIDFLFFLIF